MLWGPLFLPSFKHFQWWPKLIYHLKPCVCWSAASSFQTNLDQRRHGFPVGPPLTGEGPRPHMRRLGNPNPVETEESDPRVWPAFGLGVDSPGATRICSLLVRGTCRSESLGTTLQ